MIITEKLNKTIKAKLAVSKILMKDHNNQTTPVMIQRLLSSKVRQIEIAEKGKKIRKYISDHNLWGIYEGEDGEMIKIDYEQEFEDGIESLKERECRKIYHMCEMLEWNGLKEEMIIFERIVEASTRVRDEMCKYIDDMIRLDKHKLSNTLSFLFFGLYVDESEKVRRKLYERPENIFALNYYMMTFLS